MSTISTTNNVYGEGFEEIKAGVNLNKNKNKKKRLRSQNLRFRLSPARGSRGKLL